MPSPAEQAQARKSMVVEGVQILGFGLIPRKLLHGAHAHFYFGSRPSMDALYSLR